MAEAIVVEIREPGRPPRRVPVSATIEVGRDCRGLLIEDEAASRRHVTLTPGPDGLTVTDMGSSNGTFVNGAQLSARPRRIGPGDVVRLGETEIRIPGRANHDAETVSASVPTPEMSPGGGPAAAPAAAPAPPPRTPAPARAPARGEASTAAPARKSRTGGGVTLDDRTRKRLEAAHGWVDVEVGGVEWSAFVEAVLDAGLEQLPAVIARLREGRRGV